MGLVTGLGQAVDALLGLAFLFYLLTLLVSAVFEFVAGMFAWRAMYLAKGIDSLVDNSGAVAFSFAGIWDWLVAHFSRSTGQTLVARVAAVDAAKPDKDATPPDPARTKLLHNLYALRDHPLIGGGAGPRPSYVSARNFYLALADILRDGSSSPELGAIRRTVEALPDGDLRRTLLLFLTEAGDSADKFRFFVEKWFDESMDRLSGIYKRLAQRGTLILGLIVASTLNVDAVHVLVRLWAAPNESAALAIMAKETADKGGEDAGHKASAEARTRDLLDQLKTLDFPIGWRCWADDNRRPDAAGECQKTEALPADPRKWAAEDWWNAVWGVGRAVPGWVLTAFAISFGGPFWLDLIGNLAKLRGAGPVPAKAKDPDRHSNADD